MAIVLGPKFPELIGLGFNVVRRPKGSVSVQQHVSAQEVRVGYWANGLYEWDLTFDVLRDFLRNPGNYQAAAQIVSELRRLQGYFLYLQGSLINFAFRDPDDCKVVGQILPPVADGIGTDFILVRTYGDVAYGGFVTEPIGFPDTVGAIGPFNVYLNGMLQPSTNYDTFWLPGVGSVVRFVAAPPAGMVVSVDMSYYFNCRFKEDKLDFEKFFDKYWLVKKLTLVSLRPDPTPVSSGP